MRGTILRGVMAAALLVGGSPAALAQEQTATGQDAARQALAQGLQAQYEVAMIRERKMADDRETEELGALEARLKAAREQADAAGAAARQVNASLELRPRRLRAHGRAGGAARPNRADRRQRPAPTGRERRGQGLAADGGRPAALRRRRPGGRVAGPAEADRGRTVGGERDGGRQGARPSPAGLAARRDAGPRRGELGRRAGALRRLGRARSDQREGAAGAGAAGPRRRRPYPRPRRRGRGDARRHHRQRARRRPALHRRGRGGAARLRRSRPGLRPVAGHLPPPRRRRRQRHRCRTASPPCCRTRAT